MGGLGVTDLKVFNQALLGKSLCRFGMKEEALWRGVIADRYGELEGGWRTNEITMPFECGVWRNIMKG